MAEQVNDYLFAGGFVMPVLLIIGVVLWTALAIRFQTLRRGFTGNIEKRCAHVWEHSAEPSHSTSGIVDAFVSQGANAIRGSKKHLRRLLDACVSDAEMELRKYRALIRSLCGAAPLLGLLGTVTGMIETFSSLTSMELFSQSGGIAGGISEALISTQMGLFVAIPGVIAGRFLDTREHQLRIEIERAQEMLMRLVPSQEGAQS